MGTAKQGRRELRFVLEEGSQVEITLREWANKRGLSAGKAARCIITDWSDAMNGQPNPFAVAIAAAAGVSIPAMALPVVSPHDAAPAAEMSEQEKARQAELEEAASQFLTFPLSS